MIKSMMKKFSKFLANLQTVFYKFIKALLPMKLCKVQAFFIEFQKFQIHLNFRNVFVILTFLQQLYNSVGSFC